MLMDTKKILFFFFAIIFKLEIKMLKDIKANITFQELALQRQLMYDLKPVIKCS